MLVSPPPLISTAGHTLLSAHSPNTLRSTSSSRRPDIPATATATPARAWPAPSPTSRRRASSGQIADGVYETLVDGMELEELFLNEKICVRHYLILDDYLTWWEMGKSYLCRIVDMLHMGNIDEPFFGIEVVEEMPRIVKEWVEIYEQRAKAHIPEPKVR